MLDVTGEQSTGSEASARPHRGRRTTFMSPGGRESTAGSDEAAADVRQIGFVRSAGKSPFGG